MNVDEIIERRQIWARPTTTTTSYELHCTPFHLPSSGIIVVDHTSTITLNHNAVFQPECTARVTDTNDTVLSSAIIDLRDPFYASTSPQIYAIAAATVISYMLLIMLFITPRTFFLGGSGGGGGFLGPRGLISGYAPIIGIGGRPWLQKVATLFVTISLTVVTINTFKVAEEQYNLGYQDATSLTEEVAGSLELRIIRVVSTSFLWLAQAQTLIRLFPRYREKIIIKWTGFALIILDIVFSILNSFVDNGTKTRARTFTDAIPALTYLFELALSLLYAAAVIYYAFRFRLFAFYHSKMRNVSLVALLSFIAIFIPVVFFVLDIADSTLAGWGDYFRWVGSAAASVIVWEWVERIEALERDHKKDSILGDRIYDADEMIATTPYTEANWLRTHSHNSRGGGRKHANATGSSMGNLLPNLQSRSRLPPPYLQHIRSTRDSGPVMQSQGAVMTGAILPIGDTVGSLPSAPQPTLSPIDRTNTTSAASTVYAVRYHPLIESTSPSPQISLDATISEEHGANGLTIRSIPRVGVSQTETALAPAVVECTPSTRLTNRRSAPLLSSIRNVRNTVNPFKRNQTNPSGQPTEVAVTSFAGEGTEQTGITSWLPSKLPRFKKLGIGKHLKPAEAPLPHFYFDVRPQVLIDALAHRESLHARGEPVKHGTRRAGSSHTHPHTSSCAQDTRRSSPSVPSFPRFSQIDAAHAAASVDNSALYQRGSLMISDPRLSRLRPGNHETSGIPYPTPNSQLSHGHSASSTVDLPNDVESYVNIQDNGRQKPFVDEPFTAGEHSGHGNAP
ncbi:pH-response regulator protein palH/rim21 [Lambiella insularis]|nr:pH-response regulator protein palH/rim21 [Lambiella insularis]